MAFPVTDNFSNNNIGTGVNWTQKSTSLSQTFSASGGVCSAANAGTDSYSFYLWTADTPDADQNSEIQNLTAGTAEGGAWVRGNGDYGANTAVGYVALSRADVGNAIYYVDGTGFHSMQTAGTSANNDYIKVEVVGAGGAQKERMYKNGVQVGTDQTDATYASAGNMGIMGRAALGFQGDNFTGNNIRAISINFDAATYGSFTTGTSLTFAHTTTGTNRVLFVEVQADFNDVVTTVTYNAIGMSLIAKLSQATGTVRWTYIYKLINPTVGANNVVISTSGIVFIQGFATSYNGADQTTQPDSSATASAAAGTTKAMTTTVVASGCWLLLFAQVGSGATQGPVTAGTGIRRLNDTSFTSAAVIDSNGTVGTGSWGLTANWSATGTNQQIIISITPAGSTPPPATVVASPFLMLLGVGV